MDPHPLVSVVLPTYNREALLRESVESVFAQTYGHWELIVIDDGSTDGTRDYLGSLSDPRVRVILEEHSGNPPKVRNVGMAAARGGYIAFQDSDDLWVREKLAIQLEALRSHPECGWSYTDAEYIDERGQEIRIPGRPRWAPCSGWILEDLIELRAGIPLPSVVVERRVIEVVGGFNEALRRREDIDLWIRLAEHSQAIAVPARLMKARHHPGNAIGVLPEEQVWMDATFAGLLARTRSFRIRRLCWRRRALMSLYFVDRFRWAADYAVARHILRTSFSYAWWHPRWWIALFKTWLRPALPSVVHSPYQRLMTGGLTLRFRRGGADDGGDDTGRGEFHGG
jgi:glycosyltransferase involved in cell wall biosynthesis